MDLLVACVLVVAVLLLGLLWRVLRAAVASNQLPGAGALVQGQLNRESVHAISEQIRLGNKIRAIKMLRICQPALDLLEAKNRVDAWSEATELNRLGPDSDSGQAASPTGEEETRIAARAVLIAAGWHTAEAYLCEHHGLSPEQARALLKTLP